MSREVTIHQPDPYNFQSSLDSIRLRPEYESAVVSMTKAIENADWALNLSRRWEFVRGDFGPDYQSLRVLVDESYASRELTQLRAEQICAGSRLLLHRTEEMQSQGIGGEIAIVGCMGAGKSSLICCFIESYIKERGQDITFFMTDDEANRYQPVGTFSTGLGLYVTDHINTVCLKSNSGRNVDQERKRRKILDVVTRGGVVIFSEVMLTLSPEDICAIGESAKANGTIIIHDALMRLASGEIHPTVQEVLNRADLAICLATLSGSDTRVPASGHAFFWATMNNISESLIIRHAPPLHLSRVQLAPCGLFVNCPMPAADDLGKPVDNRAPGILLWPVHRDFSKALAWLTGCGFGILDRNMLMSDGYYRALFKEGKAIFLPQLLGQDISDPRWSDYHRMLGIS